jgi:hypothetical protein
MDQITNKFKVETARDHPYVVITMLVIIVGFLVYGLYYYFTSIGEYSPKTGSSYYGSNLLDYTPLFQVNTETLAECVNRCNMDITCSGITYNNKTEECIGTSNDGVVRQEENHYISWVKPPSEQSTSQRDFTKSIVLGFADSAITVPSKKIQQPQPTNGFTLNFNLCIRDYHHNYGKWRHILHKGTPPSPNNAWNYISWENLVMDIPRQFIGIWIAPYNNNMRIAISTIYMSKVAQNYYDHAHVQICDENGCYVSDINKSAQENASTILSVAPQKLIKNMEFIDHDITSVPLNRVANYTVNVVSNTIELYQDGKLVKSAVLEGTPEFNGENMYVLQPTSINGFVSNIIYYPAYLTLEDITNIQNIPKQSEPIPT